MVHSGELALTVVMPAKNAERTIKSAVRSALLAMPANSELLVLLDDCTDSTARVLANIKDSRLRVLDPGGKFGITKARNVLLEEARGKFVGVLDSDDLALPWRFRIQMRQLESGLDFVCGTAIVFGKTLRPVPILPQLPLEIPSAEMPYALVLANPVVHSTVMFRRSLAIDLGGYPGTWPKEDYNLWLKFALKGSLMARSWIPMSLYRFHPAQTTQSSARTWDPSIQREIDEARETLSKHLGFDGSIEELRKKTYSTIPLLKVEHFGLGGINSRKVGKSA